jgi:hypothetical protein
MAPPLEPEHPTPPHLSGHHRRTLGQLFQHPASSNIEWRAVVSLLEAVGSIEEHHDGRFLVTLGTETEMLDRPKDKDIDAQQVVDLRRMLRNVGYEPESEEAEGSADDA